MNFLKGFTGYLQTDGYAGYNGVPDVIHVGCLAHLKRKFHAVMFSMIETAKDNGLDPFKYLTYVFKTAPVLSAQDDNWADALTPATIKALLIDMS